ncbi:MAG TPA: hypothetical protein VGJ81_09840 [Thermoanaerobaculia bacterium]|jgi:hypothetical protein
MSDKLMEAYELYLQERTRLTSAKQEAAKSYDQTILTFSAGAVGLSITFLKEIAPKAHSPGPLYAAWIFFGMAMLSTLYSLLVSQRASEEQIADLDRRYAALVAVDQDEVENAPSPSALTRFGVTPRWLTRFQAMFSQPPSFFGSAVKWLNRLAAVFFIIGVLLFGWFAKQNWLTGEESHEQQKQLGQRQTSTTTRH